MAMKRPGPYVGISANYADDEKIMAAGEYAELLYIRMLAYAARTPMTEGWISDAVLASRLGILPVSMPGNDAGYVPGTDAVSRAEQLHKSGLIDRDGNGWRITSWLKWNRSIEEMGKERARDATRAPRLTCTSPDSVRDTARDTARDKATSPGNKDQDQDQDQDQSVTAPRKRGHRITEAFSVTDEMRAWAVENGFDHLDLEDVTAGFVDYWIAVAGAKGLKLDWVATWRGWVRRKAGDRPKPSPARSASTESSFWNTKWVDPHSGRESA